MMISSALERVGPAGASCAWRHGPGPAMLTTVGHAAAQYNLGVLVHHEASNSGWRSSSSPLQRLVAKTAQIERYFMPTSLNRCGVNRVCVNLRAGIGHWGCRTMTTKQPTRDDHVRSAIRRLTELSGPLGRVKSPAQGSSSREHELAVLRHVAGHIAQARRKLARELMDDRVPLHLPARQLEEN